MITKGQKLYLAHSVELIKSVRNWELLTEAKFRIILVNPFLNNSWENMQDLKQLSSRKKVIEYMDTKLTPKINSKIVKYDLKILRQCDAILAIFNEVSIGTSQELFAAWYLYNMPVYVINNKYRNHPWLQEIVRLSNGKIFKNRKEFERWLEQEGLKKEV